MDETDRVDPTPYEIERKFLLEAPDLAALQQAATSSSEIEQIYLDDRGAGAERVRRRVRLDTAGPRTELTHTRKVPVSAGVAEEYEVDVDETTYADLLTRADPARVPVLKTRWVVPHGDLVLEVDRIREPRELWLLEVELADPGDLHARLDLPTWVGPHVEVTGDERYANRSLALPD